MGNGKTARRSHGQCRLSERQKSQSMDRTKEMHINLNTSDPAAERPSNVNAF
jgi:hypothetical protein